MKKQEQEEWHNPEGIDSRSVPDGWRFLKKHEVGMAQRRPCRLWYDGKFSTQEDCVGDLESLSYILRIADDSKPEPTPSQLPDTGSRTEFATGAVRDAESMTKREQILREAIKCTTKDRQQTHGKPENSFSDIGKLWSWYKDVDFSPQDVAVMMGLMKMARIKSNPVYDDNMIDCAGYIAIAAELGGANEVV